MLPFQIELLGPLLVEERLRQAERRHFYITNSDDSPLHIRLIGATGAGLVGLGCLLQSIASRPCLAPSPPRIEVVADCGC